MMLDINLGVMGQTPGLALLNHVNTVTNCCFASQIKYRFVIWCCKQQWKFSCIASEIQYTANLQFTSGNTVSQTTSNNFLKYR